MSSLAYRLCKTYIDDLLVTSRNTEEHKEHLVLAFDSLEKGLRPPPSKVEGIRDFPPPTPKRQLQRLLGMVNFYRQFLPNCTDLTLPITDILSGPKGPLELTDDTLTTFERIMASLADATLLTHPALEALFPFMVDASAVAMGSVLQQNLTDST
ncbi:hypothetical protein SprV_0200819300 [Sparganum proliferum]